MKPIYDDDIIYEQPKKCVGCVWGKWEETKQTCLRLKCQKPTTVNSTGVEQSD